MDDSNSDLLSEKYWRTLGACVYQMVSDGLQKTHEFKSLIEFYGRERLLEEYNKEKKRHEENTRQAIQEVLDRDLKT